MFLGNGNHLRRRSWMLVKVLSFSNEAVFCRRDLSPLIKKIHPDMFGQSIPSIQSTNLKCLQTINEMCDSIEGLLWVSAAHVEVTKPLKTQYELKCYMHSQDQLADDTEKKTIIQGDTAVATKSVEVLLRTPNTLCTRQRLSKDVLVKSLGALLHQLAPLFLHASLPNPFKVALGRRTGKRKEVETPFFMEDKSIVDLATLQKEVDIKTFEANLMRTDRAIRVSRFQPTTSKVQKKDQWVMMNEQVDAYLSSGNVLVKGLSPELEVEAAANLRNFLHDYGALLNFSTRQWRYVILVLIDRSKIEIPKGTTSSSHSRNGLSRGKFKAFDTTGFRIVTEGKSYLIDVPYDFRVPAFLQFVRLNLPLSSLTAEYTQAD